MSVVRVISEEAIDYYKEILIDEKQTNEAKIAACFYLFQCYQELKNADSIRVLVQSFQYGLPRAEILCLIGAYYLEQGEIKAAIFWFEATIDLPKLQSQPEFYLKEYWDEIPYTQLAVCYRLLGQIELARIYEDEKGSK